jgi:hypothetical protein
MIGGRLAEIFPISQTVSENLVNLVAHLYTQLTNIMRTYGTLLGLFVTVLLWGQSPPVLKPIPSRVEDMELRGVHFHALHPFRATLTADRMDIPGEVKSDAWGLLPDLKVLAQLQQSRPERLEVHIPRPQGGAVVLLLYQAAIGTPDFQIRYSDGTVDREVPGLHYRGIIRGDYESLVSLSFYEDQVMGFVADHQGNRVLGPLDERTAEHTHIFYNDATIRHLNPFQCHMDDVLPGPDDHFDPTDHGLRGPGDCLAIWWEVDYDITLNKGGGAQAASWMNAMAAQVYVLYANEQIEMATNVMNVWTVPSPYTGNNSSQRLSSFQAQNGTLDGDLAHYVNLTSSYGGIAAGFSGVCAANYDNSMCYSGLNSTYQNVPTYSWTIMVCTHEKGHLIGSRHTHACVWNGNNTAIDGCSGFTEGNCPVPGQPPGGGTVMSYCHQNVGINFNLGFGPQPGNVIRNTVNNANCLDGCNPPQNCTFSLTCPGTTTVQCGPNPLPAQTGNPTVNFLSGNCSPTISYTDNNNGLSGCNGTGFFIRTFTATYSGFSATCNQTINKIDNTPPVINGVPANVNINCNAPIPGVPLVTATDNCGAATLTFNESIGAGNTCGYTINRTWTAVDACNNATSRTQVINVEDTSPPVALCKSHTVFLNANGQAVVLAADIDNGSYDNCTTITLTANPTTLSCANLGTTTVQLIVADACGNVATCNATVNVVDALAPKMQCQGLNLEIDEWGNPVEISWQDIDNGSSDNCGIQNWSLSSSTFGCDQLGENTVKLTATDASGNSAQCQVKVTVRDLIAPTFTYVPEDMTVYCVEPKPEDIPEAYDNCSEVGYLMEENQHYWAEGPLNSYRVSRRWMVFDKSGNSAETVQWISVLAEGEQVVLCTPDVITGASKAPVQAWWEAPKVSDVCSGSAPMTQIGGPVSGSWFNPGSRTRIAYEYVNDYGVRHQCAFHVVVPAAAQQDYQVRINQAIVPCADYRLSHCDLSNLPGNQASYVWRPHGMIQLENHVQSGPASLEIFADGTARLRGTWLNLSGIASGWEMDLYFYHRRDAQGWSAVGGKSFNPLGGSIQGWEYYELDRTRSSMSGTGSNQGKSLTVRSSIIYAGHGLQIGQGANGVTSGAGGWVALATYNEAGKLTGQGELRFQIQCGNSPVIMNAGEVVSLDGQSYQASWSNGTSDLKMVHAAAGTYTVTVSGPGGQTPHSFGLQAPTGCVHLWQNACRERNMAVGAQASQGSTWQGAQASRAVDGNTDGQWSGNSVSSTLQGWENYWQARLKESYPIESIRLWPRTDCCGDQLNEHYLFMSAAPIPNKSPDELMRTPGIHTIVHRGRMNEAWRTPVGVTGQYVRVQLMGSGQLQLAEVEALVCQPDRLDPPNRYELGPVEQNDGGGKFAGDLLPGLMVWPNPAGEWVELRFDEQDLIPQHLTVRNLQGQEVWQRDLGGEGLWQLRLEVSDWPQGVYVLTVQTERGPASRMIAVQR